jgi:hypothetical protein
MALRWKGPIKGLDPEKCILIDIDVGLHIPPEKSRVKYGPPELEYRRRVEEQLAEIRKKRPRHNTGR